MVNGTVFTATTGEGFLSVVLVNIYRGDEINRTVCADNFNLRTAAVFCNYFGYKQGEWGSERINEMKYVSDLVLISYLLL